MKFVVLKYLAETLEISVLQKDRIIKKEYEKDFNVTKNLQQYIDELLKEAHVEYRQIDCFVLITDNTSFTDTRIGAITCNTLAHVNNSKSFGIFDHQKEHKLEGNNLYSYLVQQVGEIKSGVYISPVYMNGPNIT